ncbi:hypothetical protein L2E82_40187 [Cichorium intybus]|uniref:Uncharacterized protein n=1 Tax=Cichorium intybus TaxID=13427 RepID=A0ACB9AJM6_CICIN|nr:hypothetical protein L2E82_40187 [Cichorium intybus]
MESSIILQSLILILLQFLCFTAGQINDFPFIRCKSIGTFTRNSTYETNLDTALASLSSTAATGYGFYNTSVGVTPNIVTAIALCRGDIESETCKDCIINSILLLRRNCAYEIRALVWNSNCTVRYSNRTYASVVDARPLIKLSSSVNASDIDAFSDALRDLAKRLRTEAAGGNSLRKFATGDIEFGTDSLKIYGLMQCSPDLSSFDCNSCLTAVFTESQTCCDGDIDVNIYFPSCNVRYSNASFYTDPPAITITVPPSTKSPATPGGRQKSSTTMYVIVPVACVLAGLLIIVFCFLTKVRRNKIAAKKKEAGTAFFSLLKSEKQNHSANVEQAGSGIILSYK